MHRRRRSPRTLAAGALFASAALGACASLDGLTSPDVGDAALPDDASLDVAHADTAPPHGDASPPEAAPVDAGPPPRCDKTKPFGTPVQLTEVTEPDGGRENTPWLTADELTLYFSAHRTGSPTNTDIFVATRDASDGLFAGTKPVTPVNSPYSEYAPSLTADGLELYLASGNSKLGGILYATRASPGAPWGAPIEIPIPVGAAKPATPFIAADGLTLYVAIAVAEPDGGSNLDIRRSLAEPKPPKFGPYASVGLDTTADEYSPVLTPDELTVYFASSRPPSAGSIDIWFARRASKDLPFGPAASVVELNTASDDRPGWVSADDCVIYLSSTRASIGERIFRAERPM
jgi:WD40-like Beta Propeller Repeat